MSGWPATWIDFGFSVAERVWYSEGEQDALAGFELSSSQAVYSDLYA